VAEVAHGQGEGLLVEEAGHDCVGGVVLPVGFIDLYSEYENTPLARLIASTCGMAPYQLPVCFFPSCTD
jgi:hypothetical protein